MKNFNVVRWEIYMNKKLLLAIAIGLISNQCHAMDAQPSWWNQAYKSIGSSASSLGNLCIEHKNVLLKGGLIAAGGVATIICIKAIKNRIEKRREKKRKRLELEAQQAREELRKTAATFLENTQKEYAVILQKDHKDLLTIIRKEYATNEYPLVAYVNQLKTDRCNLVLRYEVIHDESLKDEILTFKEKLNTLENTIAATKDYQKERREQNRDQELAQPRHEVHHHHHHSHSYDHHYCPTCCNYYNGGCCHHCYWQPTIHTSVVHVEPTPTIVYHQQVIKETKRIHHTSKSTPTEQPKQAPTNRRWFKKSTGADYKECMDTSQTFFGGPFGS